MDVLLALLHVAAYLTLALALAVPPLRRSAALVLGAAALLSLGHGFAGLGAAADGTRTLTTVHTYAGFEGSAMEVSMVRFPTGTFTAPAFLWPLPFVGFAGLWIVVLLRLGRRPLESPWFLPLACAWTATAAWLGMQVLAAPDALVQPVGLDRFLWPAGLALALIAARTAPNLFWLFFAVGLGTVAARLPAALFSKVASDRELGTVLDISPVRDIVNPLTQMPFSPRLEVGSTAQQFWLIWLEHVVFFPAVYLLSAFGIAFGAYMFHRHGPETAEAPAAT